MSPHSIPHFSMLFDCVEHCLCYLQLKLTRSCFLFRWLTIKLLNNLIEHNELKLVQQTHMVVIVIKFKLIRLTHIHKIQAMGILLFLLDKENMKIECALYQLQM